MNLYDIYNGYIYIYLVLRDIHGDQDGENGGPYVFFVVFDG